MSNPQVERIEDWRELSIFCPDGWYVERRAVNAAARVDTAEYGLYESINEARSDLIAMLANEHDADPHDPEFKACRQMARPFSKLPTAQPRAVVKASRQRPAGLAPRWSLGSDDIGLMAGVSVAVDHDAFGYGVVA